MSLIKDILFTVLVEDWYYGLVLNVILIFMFLVAVEKTQEHINLVSAIALAVLGVAVVTGYCIWIWQYTKIIPIVTALLVVWMGSILVKVMVETEQKKKNKKNNKNNKKPKS